MLLVSGAMVIDRACRCCAPATPCRSASASASCCSSWSASSLVAGEVRLGADSARLARRLDAEGGLPYDPPDVTRLPSGRLEKADADRVFAQRKAEVEAGPGRLARLVAAGGGLRRRPRRTPGPPGDAQGGEPRAARAQPWLRAGAPRARTPAVPAYGRASLADLLPVGAGSLGVPGEPRRSRSRRPRARSCCSSTAWAQRCCAGTPSSRRSCPRSPRRDLTAGFPSTTATSLASFGTGTPPGEHGLTGYTSWVEEVEATVGWLGWSPAGGRDGPARPARARAAAAAADGLRAGVRGGGRGHRRGAGARFDGSGLTRAVLRGGSYRGAVTGGRRDRHGRRRQPGRPRSLVYCYTPDLDLDRPRPRRRQRGVARAAAARRPLRRAARRPAAGRARSCTSRPTTAWSTSPTSATDRRRRRRRPARGRARRWRASRGPGTCTSSRAPPTTSWRAGGPSSATACGSAPASRSLAAGLLGPVVTPAARARTGDVVAIATGDVAVVRRSAEPHLSALVGQHGALTDDELLVPLLSTAG